MARPAKTDGARILGFVRYFHDLEKKVGIERIEAKLRELEGIKPQSGHATIKNRIFDEITRVYGISSKVFIYSSKRGNVTQARVMAIILLHKHLKLSKTELADLFGHSQSNIIALRIKTFNSVRSNAPLYQNERPFEKVYSKDFMKKIDEVDAIIAEFLTSQTDPPTDWKKW